MIAFACPQCGQRLKVQEERAGKRARCPHCAKPLTVPARAATPAGGTRRSPPASERATLLPPTTAPLPRGGAIGDTHSNADPQSGPSVADRPAQPNQHAELIDFLTPPQAPDELGRLGPYRILRVLGAGGMGVVYQAEDPNLKRHVALKAMLPALASSASARQRFLREAQSAAAIEHDHIVHIYQVAEDRGIPFLAMQFLRGEPLDQRLARETKLPLGEVVRIGRETATGLAAAHARGLIHRDIKPANLWLEGETGRVKILDFGLARAAADDVHLTQPGAIMGTPAYMAPEQAGGQSVDARCDLFSLGCVLYRLSTGVQPFAGSDAISTLMAVATHHPSPPCVVDRRVPVALSELIMRLLAKKPEDRPESALAVVASLRALEPAPTPLAPAKPRPAPPRKKAKTVKPPARRHALGLGLAALGLVLVAGGVFLAVHFLHHPSDPGPEDHPDAIHLLHGNDLGVFYSYLGRPRGSTTPYGKENDPEKVFMVQDGVLRVSGQVLGYLSTREQYANYRLIVEYRWGDKTWPPRQGKTRQCGLCVHGVGPDGARGDLWMETLRCQIGEGDTGSLGAVWAGGVPYFTADQPGPPAPQDELHVLPWPGRDKQWQDVKGFRGPADPEKPVGEWNRLECICAGDTLTVLLNGQQVNAARNLSVSRGKIAIQSSGAEIFFRTIDVVPLDGFEKSPPPEEPPWVSLFDGKDLTGWVVQDGRFDNWAAVNSELVTQGKDKGWLMTEKEYLDYEVRLEYRIAQCAMSGVALRTPPGKKPRPKGLEIPIVDDAR